MAGRRLFGYQPRLSRAGRFRSLGDGQVDFSGIFSRSRRTTRFVGGMLEGNMLPQASRGRRARGGAPLHREPHHPGDGEGLRRFRRRRDGRGAGPTFPGDRLRSFAWSRDAATAARPAASGSAWWEAGGRLHRRRAPHRGAAGRTLRAPGGGAVLDAREGSALGAALGLDPTRSYGDFREMARRERRRKDGIEAVAIVTRRTTCMRPWPRPS